MRVEMGGILNSLMGDDFARGKVVKYGEMGVGKY